MVHTESADLRVREAVPSDAALLAQLGARTFFDTFADRNTPEDMADYLAEAFSSEKQAAQLADPANVFLVVEADGRPAGYAQLSFAPAPNTIAGHAPMEIRRFYACQDWIGRGVGAVLMEECMLRARRAGCDAVWLDVWEHNERAMAFYKKWGFVLVGSQRFKLGNDLQYDLLMARPAE
jgi:GNAT superfamily N-acetyltransferase